MFKTICVGNLGADCVTKEENGKKFTTFRVAHSERWTDAAGQQHESTQWIDCIMNDRPKVCDYLLKGTTVYVSGNARLRCYSSEKARGFVAGVTIQVQSIELIGGKSDPVPSRLYDSGGVMHDVTKYYHVDPTTLSQPILMNQQGKQFAVDDNGWVLPMEQVQIVTEAGQTNHLNPTNPSQQNQMNQQGKQFTVDTDGFIVPMEQVQNVAEPGQTQPEQS